MSLYSIGPRQYDFLVKVAQADPPSREREEILQDVADLTKSVEIVQVLEKELHEIEILKSGARGKLDREEEKHRQDLRQEETNANHKLRQEIKNNSVKKKKLAELNQIFDQRWKEYHRRCNERWKDLGQKVGGLEKRRKRVLAERDEKITQLIKKEENLQKYIRHKNLGNNQTFQRILFEESDKKSCEAEIRSYLTSDQMTPDLRKLGFAPDQVEERVSDEDLIYFNKIFSSLNPNDPKMMNMRRRYPNTLNTISNRIQVIIKTFLTQAAVDVPPEIRDLGLDPRQVTSSRAIYYLSRVAISLEANDQRTIRLRTLYPRALNDIDTRIQEVISTYLAQAAAEPIPPEILDFGLRADQVEAAASDTVVKYFQKVVTSLEPADPKIGVMRIRYPRMLLRAVEQMERDKLAMPRVNRYAEILGRLQNQVVGQKIASEEVAAVLAKEVHENMVYLFVGPSGIGKTELAKSLAAFKGNHFLELTMETYSKHHTVTALFGSPPGYAGSQDKPHLAKTLETYPDTVTEVDDNQVIIDGVILLFDEMEKADEGVRLSLLTLLDLGYCTMQYIKDGKNTKVMYTLKNSIIISTSNLCQEAVLQGFQRGEGPEAIEEAFRAANLSSRHRGEKNFADEFIARHKIIPFGPIARGADYQKLLQIKFDTELPKIKKEINVREIVVDEPEMFYTAVESKLFGDGTDNRKIRNYISSFKNEITRRKVEWGDLKNIKITLFADPLTQEIFFRVSTYNAFLPGYIPTPGVEPYLIP